MSADPETNAVMHHHPEVASCRETKQTERRPDGGDGGGDIAIECNDDKERPVATECTHSPTPPASKHRRRLSSRAGRQPPLLAVGMRAGMTVRAGRPAAWQLGLVGLRPPDTEISPPSGVGGEGEGGAGRQAGRHWPLRSCAERF